MRQILKTKEIANQESDTLQVSKSYVEFEIANLVDEGFNLDKQIKSLDERLKQIKFDLKEYAKENKLNAITGDTGVYNISKTTSWNLSPIKLFKYLHKHKKTELFVNLVKVLSGEVTKYLGTNALKDVGEKIEDQYGKGTFKKVGGN